MQEKQQQQMTQGQTKEPTVQRKVQLGSKTELKNWAEIGPRSVAAAVHYRKEPQRKQQG
jgi:hypothetical protein